MEEIFSTHQVLTYGEKECKDSVSGLLVHGANASELLAECSQLSGDCKERKH